MSTTYTGKSDINYKFKIKQINRESLLIINVHINERDLKLCKYEELYK